MIAKKYIPNAFHEWNARHGAPFGTTEKQGLLTTLLHRNKKDASKNLLTGMFSAQANNDTRTIEYPWAYFSANLRPGMQILEVGGGLSGFQFVLNREGIAVDNVDPGMDNIGGKVTEYEIKRLNSAFNTSVRLINTQIENANLESNFYDRAFSISVLEHLPQTSVRTALNIIHKALKQDGLLILTIDLFLDLFPFSDKRENEFGSNISIKDIIDSEMFQMDIGNERELFGYDSFNPKEILSNLPKYYVGHYHPTLIQSIVLRKI